MIYIEGDLASRSFRRAALVAWIVTVTLKQYYNVEDKKLISKHRWNLRQERHVIEEINHIQKLPQR